MVNYHAKQVTVLIGKESTWGTSVTTDKDVGLVQNLTKTLDMTLTRSHGIGGADTQDISTGRFDGTGSIEVIFQHGRLLEYLTGTVPVHDATNTPDIKHTFALAETLPSLTLGESNDGATDIKETWKGVKILSGTVALDLDGYMRFRGDLSYKDLDPSGTTADSQTISTLKPFKDFMATVSFGAESSEVAKAVVQSFEFTINNGGVGTPKLWGIESKLPADLEVSGRIMDWRFSLAFQDVTELNRFLGSTTGVLDTGTEIAESGLLLVVNNNVAAGSGRREFNLDLSNIQVSRISKPVALGNWIIMDVEGFAKTIDDFFTYDNITAANW